MRRRFQRAFAFTAVASTIATAAALAQPAPTNVADLVETDSVQLPRTRPGIAPKPVAILPSARIFGGPQEPALRLEVPPPPDVDELKRQDEIPDPAGYKCTRVGVVVPVTHDNTAPTTFLPIPELPDGRYWSSEISAPGAVALRIHFTQFHLPEGAEIHVHSPYGESTTVEFPPFRGDGIDGDGEFWSQTVDGDRAIVEYVEPKAPTGRAGEKLPFRIESVAYIYRDGNTDRDRHVAGACNVDATCAPTWAAEADAVGRMSYVKIGLVYNCTGTLLNAQNGDLTPYFLTANHCIDNNDIASTLEVAWFYETAACNGAAPALSSCPKSLGATFLNSRDTTGTDFCLLMINGTLPGGVYWSGWTNGDPAFGDFVAGLHHPDGDYRRFSYGRIQETCWSTRYHCVQWNLGITEGGSSGSGIWNLDHRLVGQLRGGGSSCANTAGIDDYGKFSITYPLISSWLVGGTDDGFENNDSCATAWTLGEGWIFSRILRSTDPDWFRIVVPALSRVSISVNFTHANGDIDAVLYDGCGGPLVASSTGTSDVEVLRYDNVTGGARAVFLNPYLYSDTRNEYAINVTTTPCGAEDVLEPNDTCAEAWPIPNTGSGAPTASKSDPDWFRMTIPPYATLDVTASFTHAVADVDMAAYVPCGALINSSTSTGNSEFLSLSNPTGQPRDIALNVYVYSLGVGDCNVYSLSRTLRECTSEDILEDNDSCATASAINPGFATTLISQVGDEDWFSVTVPGGATLHADLAFVHARGDVDEVLYDACGGNFLASSTSTSDAESIAWRNSAAGAASVRLVTYRYDTVGSCADYFINVTTTSNQAPATATPSGPNSIYETETIQLTSWADDPEGDQVSVVIQWGDGTTSQSPFVPSGTAVNLSHQYLVDGLFQVRAFAYDAFGVAGGLSDQHGVQVFDIHARAGNVNVDATGVPVNVLRVNGSFGTGPGRTVNVSAASPVGIALGVAPAGPNPGKYAIFVWSVAPYVGSAVDARFGLGRMAMDPFLSSCDDCPTYVAATMSFPCNLAPCSTPEATGRLAPATILAIPAGRLTPGMRLYVQGFLRDNSDTTAKKASVTNGVEIVVTN